MKNLVIDSLLACPMCMSGAEGKTLFAANSAIGFMLVVLLVVLASIFGFIIHLARRARQFADELPGEPAAVSGR